MRRMIFNHTPSAMTLLGIALILIGSGFALLAPVQGQNLTQPTAAATRYVSIFDATQPPAAASPMATQTTSETSATPVPQVTRYTSIFDPPAGQAATASPVAATRIPSIFDATTPPPVGQPTRIPSIFDATQPAAGSGGAAAPTPYVSILDRVRSDVIAYQEEGAPDREYCLSCHANPALQTSLPSGEMLSVYFDEEAYLASVHGQHGTEGYLCIRCHIGMNEYPHEEITIETSRALTLDLSTSCARCHPDKYSETLDDLHSVLLASGNQDAPVCSDCHGAHTVMPLSDLMTGERLPEADQASVAMCASCHGEVYERYSASVHGRALLDGNQDVPTCADCHGVHHTEGPTDSSFRLFSPQICADCHADQALMAKYDISTDVFETYVADFHGTTVAIFQNTAPDQDFNAPVCVDCHGVHTIAAMDDSTSPALKENLVVTCQRCHPSATTNFPDAWMSHYQPSFERTPLVAIASAAYVIAIPLIVGGLGVFVASDVRRRRSKRGKDSQ